jgi:FixJ family two-component response regulator
MDHISSNVLPARTAIRHIAENLETAGEAAREAVIAVVDEEPAVRRSLVRLLSAFGYRVDLFASAREFQRAAPGIAPTFLVVGFNLGDTTGVEFVRWLSAAGFELPIIFVTGSARETIRPQ